MSLVCRRAGRRKVERRAAVDRYFELVIVVGGGGNCWEVSAKRKITEVA